MASFIERRGKCGMWCNFGQFRIHDEGAIALEKAFEHFTADPIKSRNRKEFAGWLLAHAAEAIINTSTEELKYGLYLKTERRGKEDQAIDRLLSAASREAEEMQDYE